MDQEAYSQPGTAAMDSDAGGSAGPSPSPPLQPLLCASGAPVSRAALANGHGVKVRPIYLPIEVELEQPEPAPHNSNADDTGSSSPQIVTAGEGSSNGLSVSLHGSAPTARSWLGVMRTSVQPQYSHLHAQKLAEAAAYAASFKPRAKKAGHSGGGSTPIPGHMLAGGSVPSVTLGTPAAAASSLSYSAALRRSDPALSAAVLASTQAQAAHQLDGCSSANSAAPAVASPAPALEYAYDLPAERDGGNVEYKLKLIHKRGDRLVHLTTQMHFRLSEGGGECWYELGVQDNGYARGLPVEELEESIQCVMDMAASLHADAAVITRAWGQEGQVAELRVRMIGETRSTAHERLGGVDGSAALAATAAPSWSSSSSSSFVAVPCPCPSPSPLLSSSSCDLRLALVGGSSSGKSSLLGCLVSNQRDDGRGRARLHVVRHRHEVERGRSSAIARQVLGFDREGRIVNHFIHHTQTLGARGSVVSTAATSFNSGSSAPAAATTAAPLSAPVAKKVDKGLSSLFGDDDGGSGEESSNDDEDDEEDMSDFGFEGARAEHDSSAGEQTSSTPAQGIGGDDAVPLLSFGGGSASSQAEFSVPLPLSDAPTSSEAGAVCSSNDWKRILDRSHKILTLFDMPGHADSSRTTMYGLIGTSAPDYCCIVVEAATPASTESTSAAVQPLPPATGTNGSTASASPPASPAAPAPSAAPLISSLTREQILICAALHIPFVLLLCKVDLAGPDARARIVRALHAVCADACVTPRDVAGAPAGSTVVTYKIPLLLTPPSAATSSPQAVQEYEATLDLLERNQLSGIAEEDIPMLLRPLLSRTITRTRSGGAAPSSSASSASGAPAPMRWFPQHTFTPLLLLSNVTGEGMDCFKRYLHRLQNYRRAEWESKTRRIVPALATDGSAAAALASATTTFELVGVEFSVDDIFTVDSIGSVVSGTILSGVIHEGDYLLLGPLPSSSSAEGTVALPAVPSSWPSWTQGSSFRPVLVKSLHLSRKSFKNARAGQSATLALKKIDRAILRRGMVLLSIPPGYAIGPGHIARNIPPAGSAAIAASAAAASITPSRARWPRSCVGFEAYIRLFDPVVAAGRALREAHNAGGSHSSSGLNRRRLAAAAVGGGSNGGGSVPFLLPAGAGSFLSLRGQPIIHVGNVRQGGEIVYLRLVQLKQPASHAKVEEWMEAQEKLVSSRDVDEPHPPGKGLESLLDELEREEALEALSIEPVRPDDGASFAVSPLPASSSASSVPAAPAPSPPPPLYALVRFDFLYQSEYLRLGRSVLFRDEKTRGTGRISDLYFVDEDGDSKPAASAAADAAGAAAGSGEERKDSSSPAQSSPQRKASSPDPPSASVSPAPASGSGISARKAKRLSSSPPLPPKSTSPSDAQQRPSSTPSPSPFQRTKERRALERRKDAAAQIAAASLSEIRTDLTHSQSQSVLAPQHQSHSQRASICATTVSPAVGPRPTPASLSCTPLLTPGAWPSSVSASAMQQLEHFRLPSSAVTSSNVKDTASTSELPK